MGGGWGGGGGGGGAEETMKGCVHWNLVND